MKRNRRKGKAKTKLSVVPRVAKEMNQPRCQNLPKVLEAKGLLGQKFH